MTESKIATQDRGAELVKMLPAKFALSAQITHVVACNVCPLLGTVAAVVWSIYVPITAFDITLVIFMWALSLGLGGTVGFHRYYAHRSFDTSEPMRILLAIAGSMAAQGPPLSWVCTHRRHHEFSDVEGDPHSPNLAGASLIGKLKGLWHAHCGWLVGHDIPNPQHYAPDLLNDGVFMRVNRMYFLWVGIGLLAPAFASAIYYGSLAGFVSGVLWAGLARTFVTAQFIWSVNSICHLAGFRSHETRECSTNSLFLAVPSFGESWHNNHHAFPFSARFGLSWWQLDLGYVLVWVLRALGLIWDVKVAEPKSVVQQT